MLVSRITRRTAPLALLVTILTSCGTNQQPIRVVEYTSTTETNEKVEQRILRLEDAASRLRSQYDAMGQTIMWIEGEIKALRSEQIHVQYKPLPQSEQTENHKLSPEDVSIVHPTPSLTPKPESENKNPTKTNATSHNAEISPLNDADLSIGPSPSAHETSSTSASIQNASYTPDPTGTIYLVHLASYNGYPMVKKGWKELAHKTPDALSGLKPFATTFRDDKGRAWVRLSAGPFSTEYAATVKCQEVKAEGGWCDIIKTTNTELRDIQ